MAARTAIGNSAARSIETKPQLVSRQQRHAMIAESAFRRAEQRGFQGGDPTEDWLQSEKEIDACLAREIP